jgi:murein L,D-transpeptidase YcbB/YkuD
MSLNTTGPDRASIIRHLNRFYEALGYRPAWTNRLAIARLIEVIDDSAKDGLFPSDYHIDEIRGFYANPPESPALRARADLLMTDAVFTLMSHMRSGKVYARALDSDWNIEPAQPGADYDRTLMTAVMGSKFPEIIQSLRPSAPEYHSLRKELVRMNAIAASGGWESVPAGQRIDRVGIVDPRIPAIRRRLTISGDYDHSSIPDDEQDDARSKDKDPSSSADSLAAKSQVLDRLYGPDLFDAVQKFQKRHGLEVDGVIGNETVKAMNVPVAQRIDQIRINLERYRWFLNSRGSNYVTVNIPSYTIDLVQNNVHRWSSRVIVGKPETQTPVFRAEMQYIILNPHWVIPPGIMVKDKIVETILKDHSYLDRKNLAVVDNQGHTVNPSSVDWERYLKGGFPYRLVQASGDEGSLGRIKFMIPNRFTVYLHDTPTKELFERSRRAFSHGCVRVDKPLDLAEFVLQDRTKWSKSRIQDAIDTDKTRTINLPKSIPVYILYLTAFTNGDQLEFRTDVYDRDARLVKVLQLPASSRLVDTATR